MLISRVFLPLHKLMLTELLERHAEGLETLSEYLTAYVKAQVAGQAILELMLKDAEEMRQEETHLDCEFSQLEAEIDAIISEVQRIIGVDIPQRLDFTYPDTLEVNYNKETMRYRDG